MRRWLKFHLRKIFKPIPVPYGMKKRQSYAAIYAFCAWNIAGLLLYYLIKEKHPQNEQERKDTSRWYIRLLQLEDVTVHHMSGFSVSSVEKIEKPGDLIVDNKVVVKKNELNPKIFKTLD